jgi:hypothetical protein
MLVTVLSLVLAGGGSAFAEPPTPEQYGPLTAEEEKLFQEAKRNVGAPEDPLGEGGYPRGTLNFDTPSLAFAAAGPDAVENWASSPLCVGAQQCLTGDFNGDGYDDVAVAMRDTVPDPGRGDIKVAISNGVRLFSLEKWLESLCTGSQRCMVGDVNADGMDDIVAFNSGVPGPANAGYVWVALSQKTHFAAPTIWNNFFCLAGETCEVADVDGQNGDDIITFTKGTAGDVYVARSNRSQFLGTEKWHDFFCIGSEECHAADVTGDNRADAILFVKTGGGKGRVSISPSDGGRFVGSQNWDSYFCVENEQCETGDFDGNGIQDVLTFLRAGYDAGSFGDVWVNLSAGTNFKGGSRWSDLFCLPGEDCGVGDFNGDGRDDVIRFVKTSGDPALVGQALIAVAVGSPTGFVPTPPPGGKWQESFCPGSATCATGDFNGDGLDDVVYFVRNSQAGVAEGDAYVALSNGGAFGQPEKWSDYICSGFYDVCKVGDVDGDADDDLIVFSRVQTGPVYVQRSNRTGFGVTETWNSYFCINQEWCDVGDYNGDGLTDIALFTRSAYGNTARAGDVEVAISNGSSFVPTGIWHNFFCIGNEWCLSADVNGDGADDIITFAKGGDAKVFVELSNRSWFGDREAPAEQWQNFFCAGDEVCDVGDFNGDGRDDIISFLRSNYPSNPATYGDVFVGLSQGSQAAGGFASQKWNEYFCILQETCATGYFNNDNKEDIVAFTRGTTADVYVALATVGVPYAFVNVNPPPLPPLNKRLSLPMILAN